VVQFVEVQTQLHPLLSLGVIEIAAKAVGILVRLETCPAADGASWLCLDGIGRLPVSRIGGLVLIGFRMLAPGQILLGCESADSALIDTGAQVCLIGCAEGASSTRRSPYRGPLLRGADDTLVECLSTCTFTIRFCGAATQRAATANVPPDLVVLSPWWRGG
jgi:hypothetical protein